VFHSLIGSRSTDARSVNVSSFTQPVPTSNSQRPLAANTWQKTYWSGTRHSNLALSMFFSAGLSDLARLGEPEPTLPTLRNNTIYIDPCDMPSVIFDFKYRALGLLPLALQTLRHSYLSNRFASPRSTRVLGKESTEAFPDERRKTSKRRDWSVPFLTLPLLASQPEMTSRPSFPSFRARFRLSRPGSPSFRLFWRLLSLFQKQAEEHHPSALRLGVGETSHPKALWRLEIVSIPRSNPAFIPPFSLLLIPPSSGGPARALLAGNTPFTRWFL
jgi:hypothetical protein